ncbi:TIM barrel protein [Balneolaceae bacterium YR4-1]|uniref:TIM barrel protein n=2 Tax=Halalkalibaculum roseum TaxID=2709311 RepID=A0A6M1SUX8_9BACT|nr:TIM barrel protein [Halalkalibaculum roseum]
MGSNRKEFLKQLGYLSAGSLLLPGMAKANSSNMGNDLFFDISLAQWSLHKELFAGKLTHLDFPATAKNDFGIDAVEYVNRFFADKVQDKSYLNEMNNRCRDLDVNQVLIMVDGEGGLAVLDDKKRNEAVKNHFKWVEAAEHLGCHSIRVNAYGEGTREETMDAAVDGLSWLSEFASDYGVGIIVENHGGYSSDGKWLAGVMEQVSMENCGTLPDFGTSNFTISEGNVYDRYKGVKEMMPYAKGVSAKSYAFNEDGYEKSIDYTRMLNIVKNAGFTGYIGVEYEGNELSEREGIMKTKNLLTMVGQEITK